MCSISLTILQVLTVTDILTGAANRFPDKCEVDREGARALNIDASRRLAQATSSRSILLIYISTDYVFSGKPGEAPYEANASAEPSNFYGKTKLDGETAVLEETKETNLGVVLRVPVLYGTAENPEESAINVLMNAIWKAQEKNAKVIMDDWAQRYPTNTEDVGRVCFDIAKTYIAANDRSSALPKVLQFTSEDKLTKFEICQLFAEIMGLPFSGMQGNKESGGSDTSVHKPYDTHLSNQNLKDLGISVQTQDFRAWWYVWVFCLRDQC